MGIEICYSEILEWNSTDVVFVDWHRFGTNKFFLNDGMNEINFVFKLTLCFFYIIRCGSLGNSWNTAKKVVIILKLMVRLMRFLVLDYKKR